MFLAIFAVKVFLFDYQEKSKDSNPRVAVAKEAAKDAKPWHPINFGPLSLARFKGIVVVISLTEQLRLRF